LKQYIVSGMTCAACQSHVERAVKALEGVDSVNVSLLTNSMTVEGSATPESIIKAVEDAGYGAQPKGGTTSDKSSSSSAGTDYAAEEDALKDRESPVLLRRLKLSIVVLLVLMYITMGHNMLGWPVPNVFEHNHIGLAIVEMLLTIIVMYINRAFFISGYKSVRHGAPNMDTLVAMGSGIAFLWSLGITFEMTYLFTQGADNMRLMSYYHDQLYYESAAMIPALITVGKTLESISKGRTTDALKNLLGMAPKTARVERDGELIEVSIDQVQVGDIYVVKSGESIPVDGEILNGTAAVDESALTGESIPVDKEEGDNVSAATISQSGYIRCRATRVGKDTTFAQIIQLVSDAAGTKAPIARIADRVSAVFVPAVILIAAVVCGGWLLHGATVTIALRHAITVLVISCPCALGLATPVAIMVGNGMGAKNGILFKTSESLENTGRVQIVALDKTGTITEGRPVVTDVIPQGSVSEKELLTCAYALEERSEHPLARAVVEACKDRIPLSAVEDFKVLAGNGVQGSVNGQLVRGGSGKFIRAFTEVGESLQEQSEALAKEGKTPLFFEREGSLLGIIAVADQIKEDSAEAISQLRNMGLEVVMLTGDNQNTAEAIGRKAGVTHVIAGVQPEGKEQMIRQLQSKGTVAMVGDGINDAPALTRADIGIAIGAGTDVAIDSAQIVLMNSRLSDVASAIRLSRGTLRNIHENLFWAFAYNILLIPLAAGLYPGIDINPMWGAAAMSLSSFTVCMNALRLNLLKIHDAHRDRPLKHRAGDISGVGMNASDNTDSNTQEKEEGYQMKAEVGIKGMMCPHCEAHVKKALEALDGVEEATPSHEENKAVLTLSGDISEVDVKAAVEDAGYEFVELKK
jgi:P-type Cu2+ transporter